MDKLILWKTDYSFTPKDPNERRKLLMALLEMVKMDVENGFYKLWGHSIGLGCGFCVSDRKEKEIFASLSRFVPYINFKVESMLSINEVIETLKESQK